MIYYTQLIFIREGNEETFHAFEDAVLPLLQKHHGQLLCRVRPASSAVIHTEIGYPYEIHLVCFDKRENFDTYKQDPDRLSFTSLKDASVLRVLLIEGNMI